MGSRVSESQATAFIDFFFINISNEFLNSLISPKSGTISFYNFTLYGVKHLFLLAVTNSAPPGPV